MRRESQKETQRSCTLQVSSHLKCCRSAGGFQCRRTAESGQTHLGENPGRQGLLGTLRTHPSLSSPYQRCISPPPFTAPVPPSPAPGRAEVLLPSPSPAAAGCCPGQGSRSGQTTAGRRRGKFPGGQLGSSPDKAEGQGGGTSVQQVCLTLGSSHTQPSRD